MKSHLKRLAMPKSWDLTRKKTVFIARPRPSGQGKDYSMPLIVLIRDVLGFARTASEVKYILNNKDVIVNGIKRKEPKYPVGLMDVIEFPGLEKCFRLSLNRKGKLVPVEISLKEASTKPFRIANKTMVTKGKLQLNFTDGTNMLAEGDYATGDTRIMDIRKKKALEHIKLEKGKTVFLTAGKKVGETATVQEIQGSMIKLKSESGEFETLKKYAFAIGNDKAAVTVQ